MCQHLEPFERPRPQPVQPSGEGCEECLKSGGRWVQLRLCMSCGHVGCCDSSPSRHASKHFQATRHPVIKAFEPGQDWAWCFVDEETAERIPAHPGESPPRHYAAPAHGP